MNSSWSSSHESLGETEGEFAFAVISLLIQAKQMKQPGLLYSPWQCKKQKTAIANSEGIFAFELPSPLWAKEAGEDSNLYVLLLILG